MANSLKPRQTIIPAQIEIGPSQEWDGHDGPWSSFAIQVGTPPQVVRVVPGTGSNQQMVVHPEGCQSKSDTAGCSKLRGGLFYLNESTTWENNTSYSPTSTYRLGVEDRLGFSSNNAIIGYDTLTLDFPGSGGPTIKNQSIATIATKDFFLGVLGLNPRPANLSNFNNPVPSLLQNLRDRNMIPSLSWSYTAGNPYRFDGVFGQLILGGYDKSRFVRNRIYFPFDSQDLVDLSVKIERITASDANGTTSLLPSGSISAYLDSSIPHIWLPLDACQRFEEEFGIIWNNDLQVYLVNNTQHDRLVARNASIIFRIGHLTTERTVDITLPYAAFDLELKYYPFYNFPLRYFPLKRATEKTQYTLGRTFFQEAYVIADYERKNFSVCQCNWDPNRKPDPEMIISPDIVINPPSQETISSSGLHPGAIAGIAIGVVAIFAAALYLVFRYFIKPKFLQKGVDRSGPSTESGEESKRSEFEDLPPPATPPDPYQMYPWHMNDDLASDASGASIRSENMTIASSVVPSARSQMASSPPPT